MSKYKKIHFIKDCLEIQIKLLNNGYDVSLSDIDGLYSIFSEKEYSASWYGLDINSLQAFIEWFKKNYGGD